MSKDCPPRPSHRRAANFCDTPPPADQFVHTLAQSGTGVLGNSATPPEKILRGAGSDISDKNVWKGRAKRKTIAQTLNLRLIEAVEKKGEPERKRPYWNAYHCQSKLVSHSNRAYGPYCKNRCCPLCCSIRKAEIINRYLPVVLTWEDPFFVTLTVRAVRGELLSTWLRDFKEVFQKIREKFKKRHQRGKGIKLVGIKSLECNFNPKTRTYNPHFHLIVPNEAIAKIVIEEWLQSWRPQHARRCAQHKRRVGNMEDDLIEVVKYGSKIFTDPDAKNRSKGTCPPSVYAAALDTIFVAMKPYRIFERFGFNLPQEPKADRKVILTDGEYEAWEFESATHDWVNRSTGERLAGYRPTAQLQWLLEENVNTDLC